MPSLEEWALDQQLLICTELLNLISAAPQHESALVSTNITYDPRQRHSHLTELWIFTKLALELPVVLTPTLEMHLEFACRVPPRCLGASMIDPIPGDLLLVPQGPPIIREWLFVSNCGIAFHRRHLSSNLPFSGKGNKKTKPKKTESKGENNTSGTLIIPGCFSSALKGGLWALITIEMRPKGYIMVLKTPLKVLMALRNLVISWWPPRVTINFSHSVAQGDSLLSAAARTPSQVVEFWNASCFPATKFEQDITQQCALQISGQTCRETSCSDCTIVAIIHPNKLLFLELVVLMRHRRGTSGQSARQERLTWEHQKALAPVKASTRTALEYLMVS